MATQNSCGRDILSTFHWIAFKFDVVHLRVFVILLTFWKNPLKTRWLTKTFKKMTTQKACGRDA